MEAGTYAGGGERTLSERFQDLVNAMRDLPPAARAALGLLPLFLVVLATEDWVAPLSALEIALMPLLFAVGVFALTRFPDNAPAAAVIVLAEVIVLLTLYHDVQGVAQAGLNGLSLGSIYALGAVGLTLVYGILKLVNFAHGDFLTFGAYMAYVVNVTWGAPLVLGVFWAIVATAALGVFLEKVMWGPMRARGAGMLQLLLMAIGLALVIRYAIQFFGGTELRQLDVNRTETWDFLGLSIGRTFGIVIIVGFSVLIGTGLMLRYTLLGKRMRALSDNLDLAETSGIDTARVILYTWVFAAGFAGLAGVLAGAVTQLQPELGFELLLPIFAAVVLGGIGNPFGALAGGIVLGVVIEWSVLLIEEARWKTTAGFVVLILVLIIRPQGIFGKARTI